MRRNSKFPAVLRLGATRKTRVQYPGNERQQNGAIAVDRRTVVIVSDEKEFSGAITARWLAERHLPSLSVRGSDSYRELQADNFDLAIVGGLQPDLLGLVLGTLR